jgi:hypothetical protein
MLIQIGILFILNQVLILTKLYRIITIKVPKRRYGLMVELILAMDTTGVRFPVSAPSI